MVNRIKKECKKHKLCKECPLYIIKVCAMKPPATWDKKELKRLLKGDYKSE